MIDHHKTASRSFPVTIYNKSIKEESGTFTWTSDNRVRLQLAQHSKVLFDIPASDIIKATAVMN